MLAAVQAAANSNEVLALQYFNRAVRATDLDSLIDTLTTHPSCQQGTHVCETLAPPGSATLIPVQQPTQTVLLPESTIITPPVPDPTLRPQVQQPQEPFKEAATPSKVRITLTFSNTDEQQVLINTVAQYISRISQYQVFDSTVYIDCDEVTAHEIQQTISNSVPFNIDTSTPVPTMSVYLSDDEQVSKSRRAIANFINDGTVCGLTVDGTRLTIIGGTDTLNKVKSAINDVLHPVEQPVAQEPTEDNPTTTQCPEDDLFGEELTI